MNSLSNYIDTMFITATIYDYNLSGIKDDKENIIDGMKCFYISLFDIIPFTNIKNIINHFLSANRTVYDKLKENNVIRNFLFIYDNMSIITFDNAFVNTDTLFKYIYLLTSYIYIILQFPVPLYTVQRVKYNAKNITKDIDESKTNKISWGQKLWYVIHHSSKNVKELNNDWKLSYKSFIVSLKWAMPCGICRDNIMKELIELDIDKYIDDKERIFEWSVLFHNFVSRMITKYTKSVKYEMDLNYAKKLY